MPMVTLLQGVTAANSAPTLRTDGVPLWRGMPNPTNPGEGFDDSIEAASLALWHTAYTSGVPALASARLWGMFVFGEAAADFFWTPLGTGTGNAAAATDKGRLNAGATIEGPSATTMAHAERVFGLREPTRVHLQVGAFTGVWTLRAALFAKGGQW